MAGWLAVSESGDRWSSGFSKFMCLFVQNRCLSGKSNPTANTKQVLTRKRRLPARQKATLLKL
jgi:hypothetical protein